MTTPARRELYGIAEIADALGQSRQLVTVWRRRRTRGMPEPDAELASGPVWRGATIEPWIDDQIRLGGRDSSAAPLPPATVRKSGAGCCGWSRCCWRRTAARGWSSRRCARPPTWYPRSRRPSRTPPPSRC